MTMRLRGAARCLTGALLALPLAACGTTDASSSDGPVVAAGFYPLAWTAERVAGEHAGVENLTAPGGEPHDSELSIEQTALVSEADLVVHLEGFQPAVDAAVTENATGEVVDAAEAVEVRPDDPHFWLDPLLVADLGDALAERLAELDPPHAEAYAQRAASLREELEALDRAYAEGLADCARDTVVVSHDAFGYLSKYGLRVESIVGLSPDAEPTPATLAQLKDLIEEEDITTVFAERLVSPATAEALAAEAGVRTAVLDPVEGLGEETADEDYLSLMRANLAALQEANGC